MLRLLAAGVACSAAVIRARRWSTGTSGRSAAVNANSRMRPARWSDPYRYRLPNADDAYWDRGELPPLPELGPLFGP
jgi:hypothetical protein